MRIRFLFVVVAFAAFALSAATASADPKKPYTVNISPASVATGANAQFTVTITNKAKQTLEAANVTVPSAFEFVAPAPKITAGTGTLTQVGNVLQLRNLSLATNRYVTVTLGLKMPCVAKDTSFPWEVVAKQANNFNGAGNEMGPVSGTLSTLVKGGGGASGLHFVNQPADAETNAPVRALPFQPTSSDVVTVEVLRCGERDTSFNGTVELRLTPGGDPIATATAVAGLASFPNLTVGEAGTFTLVASAGSLTTAQSVEFDVFDAVETCTGTTAATCTAMLAGTNTSTTVSGTGGSGSGFVVIALAFGTEPVCAGYTPPTPDWYEFRTTVPRDKTVEAIFSKAAVQQIGGVSKLQICFAAPRQFTVKGGGMAQPFDYDGDPANRAEGFVGLLPDCNPYKQPTTPCIKKRESLGGYEYNDRGGSSGARIVFVVPLVWGGDPRWH